MRVAMLCGSLLLSACGFTTPGEPAPPALRSFLEALSAGRYEDAYSLTQLDEVSEAFGEGSAVTQEHFVASWSASPLESFEVVEVVRLRRRAVTDFGDGTPYFETRVRLNHASGSRTETIAVDGEVNGTVQIDPLAVRVLSASERSRIEVDGVAVEVTPDQRFVLLLLPGSHQVRVGEASFSVSLDPFEVSGEAVISEEQEMTIEVI